MLADALMLGLSIVGSFIGVGFWHTLHMDDFFAAHHERVEARRARRRWRKATEYEKRLMEARATALPASPPVGTIGGKQRLVEGEPIGQD